MRYRFVALLASLALAFGTATVALSIVPAEATRPGPNTKAGQVDRCRNIPGRQPAYMLVGTGPYRMDHKGRCYRVTRVKG